MANHDDEFDLLDEDFDLDDWGMGDDLDGGDFLSDTPAKNDRNPVLRLGGKFVSGLGKTFVDTNVQRRMIKDNLPDGFAAAYDAGLTGINAINDIKRDVDRNMGAIVTEAKQTLSRVSPTIEKQLPPALAKRLNEFTNKHGTQSWDSGSYNPDEQERAQGISSFLEQVEAFKLKEETTKRNVMNRKDARELRNDTVQQRLLDAGNRTQMHTNAILNRILGYHTEVTTNFQMKSLELQYNQFFMLRKGVDLAEQSLSLSRDSYDKIIKNTGLPDALKLRTLEHAGFLAKENVINKLNGKFSDTVGSFVNKGVKQIGENLSNKAEELKSAMGELESMVSMLDMLNDMEDEPPGAREQTLRQLEMVFSTIGSLAGGQIEKVARKYAEKKSLKSNAKLVRYSEKIKAFMGQGAQRLNSFMSGNVDTGNGFLDGTVRDLIGGAGWSQDTKLTNNNYDNLGESSFIDFKTKRTINDVIPGYLKLIHHELLKTRTGDENVSPMSFDWERNRFNTDKSIGARLTEKLTGNNSVISKNANSINSFIKSIDPGKELSPETRKTLAGLVSKNMADGGSVFDVYTMMNDFNPQGPNGERQRQELTTFLEKRGFDIYADTSNEFERSRVIKNQSETSDRFYNIFNKGMSQTRWDYESSNEEYQRLIELGFGDQLAAAGLVVQDEDGGWSVNQENIDKKTQRRSYRGFAVGGGTGPGDKYQPKGIVHADEFVVRSEVAKQPGVKGFLDQLNIAGSKVLNRLGGYASGGTVQETNTDIDNLGNNKAGVTLESIIEAIRSINPITHLKDMTQSLKGIEFKAMRDLMGNVEELPQSLRTFYENNIRDAKPGATIKQTWDRFTQRAKQNKIWDIISQSGKDFTNGFKEGYDKTYNKFAGIKEATADASDANYQADIYTEDDTVNPKLTVDGFKNGEYFDELTGHPVESVKDIKGTVVDKWGNIKLHAKDLGKKLISPSTYVMGVLKASRVSWALQSKALGLTVGFLSKHDAWGKVGKAYSWLKSSISNMNTDVYIEGQEEPVLYLKDIKAGNLYNGERKKIESYNHIVGDIYDKEGNIVLAESAYADAKLVGADGKPLKGFVRKQIRRIKNVAKLGWAGVKGFNKFRKKAWQAQFKLMYGVKDVIRGTKKKTPEQLEEERYNEYMMQNANPDGLDQYTSKWDRFKGKVKGFQKDTRDYLTGERDKRKASEANIGQLLDHDGNPVENKKDAFDTLVGWVKSGKEKLVDKAKDKLGQATGNIKDMSEQAQYQAWLAAKTINNPDRETGETLTDKGKGLLDTAQGKLKTGIDQAKDTAADIAEKVRLETWMLKNTLNNPDRETGETLSDKAKGGVQNLIKKAQASVPDWLLPSNEDDDDLKAYRAKLRGYWIQEKREQFSGILKVGKGKINKVVDWKEAEKTLKKFSVSSDDVRYEIKKFDMFLKDKGLDKASISKTAREKADKLKSNLLKKMPTWMEEFTTDDDEVKKYKATLRKKWLDEEHAKLTSKGKKLHGKLKTNWANAQKQLESMMPNEEQKANFRKSIGGFVDKSKTNIMNTLNTGKSKFKEATGKWGLDKDEKGVENKQYRDKGVVRLVRDIHRLLDERLSKPKKGLWNDTDGNGFREGSIEDQLADREKSAKKDPNTKLPIPGTEKKKSKGMLGILMAIASGVGTVATMIGGLVTKAMGFGKLIKDWVTKQAALKAASSVLGGKNGGCCCGCNDEGQDYLDRDKKKRRNRKSKGRGRGGKVGRNIPNTGRGRNIPKAGNGGRLANVGSKLSQFGTKLARGPGWAKALGVAALVGGGALATTYANADESGEDEDNEDKPKTGGVWNGIKDTLGLNTANGVADFAKDTAISTGVMAAATGAVGGAMAGTGIAAGALAALGGPITLGIVLGGAAIYGGIKLYQAMSKGDKPLLSFRMAQYGFKDSSKSEISAMLKLESELFKQTRVQGGSVNFTKADEAVSTAIKTLGIDTKSPMQMKYFAQWFSNRFKPVFFAWVAATTSIKKGITFDKLDETFKPQEKLDLMASVHSEVKSLGVYEVTTSYNADKALLGYGAVDKLYKSNQNLVEAPAERATKEKAIAVKQEIDSKNSAFMEQNKTMFSSATSATGVKGATAAAAATGANATSGSWFDRVSNTFSNAMKDTGISGAWNDLKDGVSNTVASMSGSQKEWQMKVYSAFKKAGFSEQQSRILTAEIGRENAYNPKYLFGGHADPHSGTNLGMLSWQGARTPKLVQFLRESGVLDKRGNMVPGQAALDAQAKFIMWEMNNTHKKAAAEFLGNPNIDYAKGAYIVGKKYILWRIDDPKYGPSGKKNRDGFYNMLLKQLGSGAKVDNAQTPPVAPQNKAGIPVTLAKPGTNTAGLSLDPSKKPNVGGMAMPGAPKSGASDAGILTDPNKKATVGNSMGNPNDSKFANHKAVKAAKIATSAASSKSTGYCAKYVANALTGGGYKFTRQGSAYMYHTNGILAGMGMVVVNTTTYQIGDVAVWPAHGGSGGGGIHGHIQIFNGKNWVSDFIQRSFVPGKSYGGSKPTVYRDKELVGSNVNIVVDSNKAASDMTVDKNSTDATGATTGATTGGVAAMNTKYQNMTIGDIIKKRNESKTKIYGADGSVKDFNPGKTETAKPVNVDNKTTKTSSASNPNNTSMKPTTIPGAMAVAATPTVIGSTVGGKTVDEKKEQLVNEQEAKKSNGTSVDKSTPVDQVAMRNAKMSNSASSVGNTSANFPAESIRLFTSMDSKLSQVVTALNKIAVIGQDSMKVQIESSNRQAKAMSETAKAMTTVATAAVSNKSDDNGQKKTATLKPGVIGADKPQPVSVLS